MIRVPLRAALAQKAVWIVVADVLLALYRPVHRGLRLLRKASTPSLKSSLV